MSRVESFNTVREQGMAFGLGNRFDAGAVVVCRFPFQDHKEEPYEPLMHEILQRGMNFPTLPSPSDLLQAPSYSQITPPTISAALWRPDETVPGRQATAISLATVQQIQSVSKQEHGEVEETLRSLPLMQVDDSPEIPVVETEDDSDGEEFAPDEVEPPSSPLATQ